MSRSELQVRTDIIDPELRNAGWDYDCEVLIGPGRVSLSGESMYEESQELRADYILRMGRMPLAVLEAKAADVDAAEGARSKRKRRRI